MLVELAAVLLQYHYRTPALPRTRRSARFRGQKKKERGKASMVITKPAVFQPFTQAEPVEADGHPEIHILIGPRGANVEQGKESHGQATAGNHNLTSPFPSARVAGFASLGRQLQSHPSPRSVGGGHRPVCC
jgi:hypothetical protein